MGGHPLFKKMTEAELKLHDAKNSDYAKNGNPLGNFDRVGKVLSNYPGLDPGDPVVVAMTYLMKQLDASLWMLCQGYEGKVEDFDARMTDVHVYAKLARILHKEKKLRGEPLAIPDGQDCVYANTGWFKTTDPAEYYLLVPCYSCQERGSNSADCPECGGTGTRKIKSAR